MKNLREQMKIELEITGYCQNTQSCYVRYAEDFFKYTGKTPKSISSEEIEDYLHYLIKEKQVSTSYINGVYSALKFFYERTLKQNWIAFRIPRRKVEKRLPYVLDVSEVKAIIESTQNLKHKAILMVTYSSGLRVSETAALKMGDIDSKRMQIRVTQGKGKKDRYTILSKITLNILRDYYKIHRPVNWLFPGIPHEKALSSRSIQRIFETAKDKAGIKKSVSIHALRHSFATHLLESGTDIHYIQQLLGHSCIKTTSVYIHISRKDLIKIVSPLDSFFK